jgi:glyoxylase-like metal-dependent hydrolase (beta-lactamase superfamily II)
MTGRRLFVALVAAIAVAAMPLTAKTPATPAAKVSLVRLECGSFDVKQYEDLGRRTLSNGCYLIRHGDDYMAWDAGLDAELVGNTQVEEDQTVALGEALGPQFARLGIDPAQVALLGVSHYHGDHLAQAGIFTSAKLLMGAEDFDYLSKNIRNRAGFPWIDGKRPVEKVAGDRDIYGDGSVVMLATPGHTPGHHSLLVRLPDRVVILTGDAVHQRDQLESGKVPGNGTDLVKAAQSLRRMLDIARQEQAQIIVQHDPRDIPTLPAGPAAE